MYNRNKKVTIVLALEYEYENELIQLKELLKQIIDMGIVKKIDYDKE